jgi:hypothetical protein
MEDTISPIFEIDGSWFFWDELWVDTYGPYKSEDDAKKALNNYCKEVLG